MPVPQNPSDGPPCSMAHGSIALRLELIRTHTHTDHAGKAIAAADSVLFYLGFFARCATGRRPCQGAHRRGFRSTRPVIGRVTDSESTFLEKLPANWPATFRLKCICLPWPCVKFHELAANTHAQAVLPRKVAGQIHEVAAKLSGNLRAGLAHLRGMRENSLDTTSLCARTRTSDVGARQKCAIVCMRHLNKGGGTKAI
jgi:hypothetical protein